MADWEFNDPIEPGFDWSYIYTLRKLEKSGWERLFASVIDFTVPDGFDDDANPTFVSMFNVEDDIQYVANLSMNAVQQWVHGWDASQWYPIGFSIASLNPTIDTIDDIFGSVVLDDPFTTYQLNLQKALLLAGYADPDFTDYRRQTSRTVDNDESLTDQEMNPAAIGQTALVMGFASGDYAGQIRKFDGETWSIYPGVDAIPDLLDSHYSNVWANIGELPIDARQCFPQSLGTPGEFISHIWIFKQIRDVAKQYKTMGRFVFDIDGLPIAGSIGFGFDSEGKSVSNTTSGSEDAYATAIADVESLWDGYSPTTDYAVSRFASIGQDFSSHYLANAVAGDAKYGMRMFVGRPKSVDLYVVVSIPGDGTDPRWVFDDQGEGVSLSSYNHIFGTAEQSDEITMSPAWPFQLLNIPPDWPGDPGEAGFSWLGFEYRKFAALIVWDFEFQ